jgi:hypothetical protein
MGDAMNAMKPQIDDGVSWCVQDCPCWCEDQKGNLTCERDGHEVFVYLPCVDERQGVCTPWMRAQGECIKCLEQEIASKSNRTSLDCAGCENVEVHDAAVKGDVGDRPMLIPPELRG